jgi:hypothetical protein
VSRAAVAPVTHYQVVDTIIGPLFRKAISYIEINARRPLA